jgi:hypothetical protein
MHALALYGIAISSLGMVATSNMDIPNTSSLVLVQGVSGEMSPGSTNRGVDMGKSGTSKETDAGRGEVGKHSFGSDQPMSGKQGFGSDQPTSGDFTPNPSAATKSDESTHERQKGSGQSASSMEQHGSSQPSR